MPLSPGDKVGHFEIEGPLGAGGMGEVYRARDTELDRNVALKILPEVFADDPQRLMRFEREAKTLAALNHPNIAQIYGVERSASMHALVMELVDGVTIDRTIGSPMPVADALAVARQMAEALEFAHERGIIHRDLKPTNVMLTSDGSVKVLDFGLAKALEAPGAGPRTDVLNAPTITSPAFTNIGVILGTAAYMAPEQAKGKPVDRRADIWTFGIVLFEMLSGRQAFRGETVTETIAQVITQPPDWTSLPTSTPAGVRRLLRRCLEKEPRSRFQSAGDLRVEIEELLAAPSPADAVPAHAIVAPQSGWRRYLPWGISALLLIALAGTAWRAWTLRTTEPAPLRLEVRLTGSELVNDNAEDGALVGLSPDGQMLAYRGTTQAGRQLYLRRLDSLDATPLVGTQGATVHAFSPDGKWIAFSSVGSIKKVAVAGGAAFTIAESTAARGLTWGTGDTIVYTPNIATGLFRVSAAGGTPVELTVPVERERSHRWPWLLPDGKTAIFVCQLRDGAYDDGTIEAIRIDQAKPQRKVLIRGGTFPRFLATGHLVFTRGGTLFAVPFDPQRLEVKGEPQPVLTGVLSHSGAGSASGNGAAQIAFSNSGTAAYLSGGMRENPSRIVITDRSGKAMQMTTERGVFRSPRFSPDGKEIAFQAGFGTSTVDNIHVWNLERNTIRKVTFEKSVSGFPVWSRDGRRIAYFSDRERGITNIYITRSDGAGEPEAVTPAATIRVPLSFSPDSAELVFMELAPKGFDLMVLSLADKKRKPFLTTPAQEMLGMFSPDGKWLVYESDESGAPEVYARPYPGPGGKWQLSSGGGAAPVWTKGGSEVVYVAGVPPKRRIMSVEISAKDGVIQQGAPKLVFETPLSRFTEATLMDVSPDGSRFALVRDDEEAGPTSMTHVTLILNFFSDVRRAFAQKR